MPTKIATETQLLRLLGNTALQVNITLLHTATHKSRNTDPEHLLNHYETFEAVRNEKFDGLIITGAPVEQMPFEEVDYWRELTRIMDWAETNVESTFYICWGAQAGLYHRYGIPKYPLPRKMFGVFAHRARAAWRLLRGFDDVFYARVRPHRSPPRRRRKSGRPCSCWPDRTSLACTWWLRGMAATSSSPDSSRYDPLTLKGEYDRDVNKGLPDRVPVNYYRMMTPRVRRSFAGADTRICSLPTG